MQSLAGRFVIRWLVSSLGLWIAAAILGSSRMSFSGGFWTIVGAGLVLALINMIIRPLLLFLSIPAIILTLGLFMLVVNGFIILIVSWLYSSLYIKNLGVAIVAGLIVGLVNYLVTRIVEDI